MKQSLNDETGVLNISISRGFFFLHISAAVDAGSAKKYYNMYNTSHIQFNLFHSNLFIHIPLMEFPISDPFQIELADASECEIVDQI